MIRLKKLFFSEIGIILMGASIIALLLTSSYFIFKHTQESNSKSYQNVIQKNLKYQAILFGMSNSIRDRMLVTHDINVAKDPFTIDELNLEYQALAVEFITARDTLLRLNLPRKQIRRLGSLRESLNQSRNALNQVINQKVENNDGFVREDTLSARKINKHVLSEINLLIDQQSIAAIENLFVVLNANKRANHITTIINISSLFISILIITYIIKLLNKRKRLLDEAIINLEHSNKNLEQKINSRTGELLELQKVHSKVNAEMEVSRELQEFITPAHKELRTIKSIDIATYVETAESMGGDYVDVLPYHNGHLICIGDVTDHGLKSGIIMVMIQSIIRHQSNHKSQDIKQALIDINISLFQNIQRMKSDRHLSLSLIHHQDNQLTLTGQHETIILIRANGGIEKIDTDELGFYIGFIEDISPFVSTMSLSLETDDLILLHTDGITEAANNKEELYGFERLCQQALKHSNESASNIVHNIISDVNHFVGSKALYDDLALIAFKQL